VERLGSSGSWRKKRILLERERKEEIDRIRVEKERLDGAMIEIENRKY